MVSKSRSDVAAKEAYVEELRCRGYEEVRITATPADIIAIRDGLDHYFEIKFTNKSVRYFGAATLTEWEAAIEYEDRFLFVIARRQDGEWVFEEYTPAQFMEFSYIPPFKIFFNVGLGKNRTKPIQHRTSIRLTRDRIQEMLALYTHFRRS